MNDYQIKWVAKVFCDGKFSNPIRGDSNNSSHNPCSMTVASLLLRKQLKTTRLPFCCKLFSVIWSVLQDDNLIHFRSALASSNSCGLQTLHCFLFLGLMMNYHWKLQCMYFRFHFQKNPQWKCHSQGHWLTLKVNVVGDKSASVIFVSRFPISRAGIKRESSL